jgi:hypothetical protein
MATLVTGRMVQDGTVAASDLQPGLAVPTGAIMAFGMLIPPVGWLPCDGVAVSRTTFSALFSAIGTTYGVGDNSTTFNVPNLQGQFVRGLTTNLSTVSRDPLSATRVLGNVQEDLFRSHNHTTTGGTYLGGGTAYGTFPGGLPFPLQIDTVSNTGGNETRPVNIALLFCIKL